jgi:hypothetical protein
MIYTNKASNFSPMATQTGGPDSSEMSFNAREIPVQKFSVADPGCLSRILNFLHPGFAIFNPTTTKRVGKK